MTYVISKPAAFEGTIYVTKVLRGGIKLDNVIVRDPARLAFDAWQIKKYRTLVAAQKELAKLHAGGFTDYEITEENF